MSSLVVYLKQHHIFRQSIFHAISLPLVLYSTLSPGFASGPCNPGAGFLIYALVFLVDIILIPVSFLLFVLKGLAWRPSLFVSLFAIAALLAMGAIHR